MNKITKPALQNINQKQRSLFKLLFVLNKIIAKYKNRNISQAFNHLYVQKKKYPQKFNIILEIQKRKLRESFIKLLSFQPKQIKRNHLINLHINFSISVLNHFINKIERNQKQTVFIKLKSQNKKLSTSIIINFAQTLLSFGNSYKRNYLIKDSFLKIKKINLKIKQTLRFYDKINSFIQKINNSLKSQLFMIVLLFGYKKAHLISLKTKQDKIVHDKNFQLNKNQQLRMLKIQINNLSKNLQFQESSKTKIKKQDYDRIIIIQAKKHQNQRNKSEVDKASFQNQKLVYQLNKKQEFIKNRQRERVNFQNAQKNFIKIYSFLKNQKTKQSMTLKQISIYLQRNQVNLADILKKFSLSNINYLLQNIDLKNMLNLYQKQMNGYGVLVNIKQSQTYRKTMEENINLREILQIILFNSLQEKQQQICLNKEELYKIVQSYQNSQKGSKITFTTIPSSLNGAVY